MDPRIETNDLTHFNPRALAQAANLLQAYAQQTPDWLGSGVELYLNYRSGLVYLIDRHEQVAMMDKQGRLRQWWSCLSCGVDGFDGEPQRVKGRLQKKQFIQFDGYCSQACQQAGEE